MPINLRIDIIRLNLVSKVHQLRFFIVIFTLKKSFLRIIINKNKKIVKNKICFSGGKQVNLIYNLIKLKYSFKKYNIFCKSRYKWIHFHQ